MANQSVQRIDERSAYPISTRGKNKSDLERLACGAAGGALFLIGLRRPSLKGLVELAAGAWLLREAVTGHSYTYQLLGIDTAEEGTADRSGSENDAREISQSVTVGRPLEEVYRQWRDPEIFARIVNHFATVTTNDPDRAHWSVTGPLNRVFQWDARVVEEEANRLTRWETLPGADVPNEATVAFKEAPGGRGTEIHYVVRLTPPGGLIGHVAFDLAQALPKAAIHRALRKFKSLLETGEIPTNNLTPQEAIR